MCNCDNFCPKCAPGIDAFYQEKVQEAKEIAADFRLQGMEVPWEDLLDAKEIWYEYVEKFNEEIVDDITNEDVPVEIYQPNSWEVK